MIGKNALCYSILFWGLLFCAPLYCCAQHQADNTRETQSTTNYERETSFIEAEKYYVLGDYEKALMRFKKAAQQNPSEGTIYYKIAQTLSKVKNETNWIEATANIEKALSLEKDNEEFYLLAAYIYSQSADFSKSLQVLETMIKEIENTENHLYLLGATYSRANKLNKAINTYNQAERTLGISAYSSLPKEKIYIQQGKIKEAITEITKLTKAFPEEERYTLELAELLSQQGQKDEAIVVLNHFIKTQPGAQNAKILLIKRYREQGKEQKAREIIQNIFKDAVVGVDDKLAILSIYIEEMSRSGKDSTRTSLVLELFNQLQIKYPGEPEIYIAGGDLYLILGQKEKAKKYYQTAIQKGSTHFKTWQNVLHLEYQQEQFDSLILHSEKGLELFPNQAMFYYFNGYARMRKKNYRQAAYALEQARRMALSTPGLVGEINQLLGQVYHELKEYKKSDSAYDEALLINPDNPTLLNNYSYYLALRKANLDKAEKMATQALKSDPTNSAYLDTYAWVLFVRGKYKKAEKIMQNIIKKDPTNPVFFDHYGDILFKAGNIEEAVKQWEKAKQKGGSSQLLNDKIVNKKLP